MHWDESTLGLQNVLVVDAALFPRYICARLPYSFLSVPDLSASSRAGAARMSGTSLARQLAALRTPGTSLPTSATYAGPFLFPEAGELTSLAALKENAAESLNLLYSEDPGMSR